MFLMLILYALIIAGYSLIIAGIITLIEKIKENKRKKISDIIDNVLD